MENFNFKELWVDKYRPKSLKDYVLDKGLKSYFKDMIKNKSLQNMTFLGVQGSGKTTLAKILCNEFKAEVLFVKCATEGTIDTLRTKITEFCNAMTFDGSLKVVVLDEVDSASSSGDNNFQKGLRTLIESATEDTRFILTANYNKILQPILSRCPLVPLKFDKKDLLIHIKHILDNEGINYNKESILLFIEEAFRFYPDVRRIINYLQFCCNSGSLVVKLNAIVNSEKEDFLKQLVDKIITSNNILDIRKFYLGCKEGLGDLQEAGSLLYNYVIDNNIVTDEDGILKLTDLLYQLSVCVDKECLYFGMVVAVKKYMTKD